jgi:ferredoxin-type protein NapH
MAAPHASSQTAGRRPAAAATEERGCVSAHKWLLLRRASQIGVLGLFLVGPLAGVWVVKGNLASSLTLDTLPLTDPYLLLQTLLAGHLPETAAVIGAVIVAVFYLAVGGRAYCAWVCPVNIATDAAGWLHERLGLKGSARFARATRYWLLGLTLALPLVTGALVWELVNPVSIVFRGLIFGMGLGWFVVLAIFLFDLFVSRRGWCGHLCPVGAFYSLIGQFSLVRVSAAERARCDDCMDCFVVCPEPQVIRPALKGADQGVGPLIDSANCTNCGRCIDVCSKDVFRFSTRFHELKSTQLANHQREVTP